MKKKASNLVIAKRDQKKIFSIARQGEIAASSVAAKLRGQVAKSIVLGRPPSAKQLDAVLQQTLGGKLGHAMRVAYREARDIARLEPGQQGRWAAAARRVTESTRDLVTGRLITEAKSLLSEHATRAETQETLRDVFEDVGLSPDNKFRLSTVFSTWVSAAYHAGLWEKAQEDDDLWGWEYVTQRDDRVRDEHEQLDGIILPKDHPFWLTWWPPNGYGCRCGAAPIYLKDAPDEFEEPDEDIWEDGPEDEEFASNFQEF